MKYAVFMSGLGSSTWFFGRRYTKWARMLRDRLKARFANDVEIILISSDGNRERALLKLLKRLKPNDIICIGCHSNGGRDTLLKIAEAQRAVDYVALIDMTLVPKGAMVTRYIKKFSEFHARLRKAVFAPDFNGVKSYQEVDAGHVAAASQKGVQDKIFREMSQIFAGTDATEPVEKASAHVLKYQTRLKALKYYAGPLDGIRGAGTISAAQAFQRRHNIKDSGIVGPKTMAALFPDEARVIDADAMPWMNEAERMKGTTEISGPGNNNTIMGWARKLGLGYSGDNVPWCGLFVAQCISSQLPKEPLPGNVLGARQWLKFGKECGAIKGAVVVFWRGKKSGWTGHVGFVVGSNNTHVYVLGGNQSDQVNIRKFPKNRVLGYRWPSSAPMIGEKTGMSGGKSTDGNEA